MAVVIETTIGDFTVDLFIDERPQTCRNFLKLCKIKYYNWNLFHSVQSNFIAQTGDPTGNGKGGESIYGKVLGEDARYYEAEQMPKIKHDRVGLLSMVNCGNNMLGSQFFITLASELQSLDGEHCVFGEIAEGLEIILKFNETICDGDHRPYQDIRISHTVILEDPFDDPKGLIIPDRSPEPTKEALMSDRIGADEVLDDTAGMTVEEIVEMQKEKEAKARATILEIVGDIPDAEMAPPENVLFVCKLNPVTNDDDLEIIFSRFGKIVGCEVIRDRQSGDSLQYAFIEFADRKSCEEAYFKMDNVLIDDRRIHVDFSQSVAKMRWRGKGKGIKFLDDREGSQVQRDGEKKASSPKRYNADSRRNYQGVRDSKGVEKKRDTTLHESSSKPRKHECRKEGRNSGREYSENGGKYSLDRETYKYDKYDNVDKTDNYDKRIEKQNRKKEERFGNKSRRRSNERQRDRSRERSRDRSSDRSKDRNRDRSKDRLDKNVKRDTYSRKERENDRRSSYEKKRKLTRQYSSGDEDVSYEREQEKHSKHERKHNRNRSEERHKKKPDNKYKRKNN